MMKYRNKDSMEDALQLQPELKLFTNFLGLSQKEWNDHYEEVREDLRNEVPQNKIAGCDLGSFPTMVVKGLRKTMDVKVRKKPLIDANMAINPQDGTGSSGSKDIRQFAAADLKRGPDSNTNMEPAAKTPRSDLGECADKTPPLQAKWLGEGSSSLA